jgi:hypothetical protein
MTFQDAAGAAAVNPLCYDDPMRTSLQGPLLAVVAASLLAGAAPVETRGVLPFIADDYPAALAQARARKLPIFVEAWAPW